MQLTIPRQQAALPEHFRLQVVEVRPDLWRVSSLRGTAIGHITVDRTESDAKFIATRVFGRTPRRVPVGTFWSIDDAIQAFVAV